MMNSTFRVVQADLHAERADVLELVMRDVFIGKVSPSALDFLDGNIQVVIPTIQFDRSIVGGQTISSFGNKNPFDPNSPAGQIIDGNDIDYASTPVIGDSGVGTYWKQAGPVTISTYSVHPYALVRQDTFGKGYLAVSRPDEQGQVTCIWKSELTSSVLYTPQEVQSFWLYQLNAAGGTIGKVEIVMKALPGQDVLALINSFQDPPNMAGNATITYGDSVCPGGELP